MDRHDMKILHLLLQGEKAKNITDILNISQSAISARINKMRSYFDDPITVRKGREMVLTEKIKLLSNSIERLYENIESLYPIEYFDATKDPAIFNLSISESHCQFCFDEYIEAIYGVNKAHEVRINVFPSENGIERWYDFQNAELIIGANTKIKGYKQEIIAFDQHKLIHNMEKLLQLKKIGMRQYLSLPHVVFAKDDESNTFLEYLSIPDPRRIMFRTNNAELALEKIHSGECVASVSSYIAKKHPSLSTLNLPYHVPKEPVTVAYPSFLQLDARNMWLRKLCSKVIYDKSKLLGLEIAK